MVRSLILAGGGLKVAYQAGCLQVLLDEAKIDFDHVDATSGGCFNAAMLASGMSGTQVADCWRTMNPFDFLSFSIRDLLHGPWAEAIGTNAGLRRIFRDVWRLDFDNIRHTRKRVYTFNHYNFTEKRVVVVKNAALDEETLLASVSLLMWLPPIRVRDDVLFDAAYVTDANVAEALCRGASELWAIWTLTNTPEVRKGFFAQYFHILQAAGNARFRDEWAKAAMSGAVLHLIEQEVAVHETFVVSRDRIAAAVELGVRDTRAYLKANPQVAQANFTPQAAARPVGTAGLRFVETMAGYFMPGVTQEQDGFDQGKKYRNAFALHLTVEAADLDTFLHQPEHRATLTGTVVCPLISATPLPIEGGTFECLRSDEAPGRNMIPSIKTMRYTLRFSDKRGNTYRLEGIKNMRPGSLRKVWPDTTTLFTHVHISSRTGCETHFGAGILHVSPLGFFKQLATMRAPGSLNVIAAANALRRFNQFFVGALWDVYLRDVIVYAPF